MAKFKWLHISDLHIPSNSHDYQNYKDFVDYILEGNQGSKAYDQLEKKGMRGIVRDAGGIDCIIITGDCFHHGVFSQDAVNNVSSTISLIYRTCSEQSDWRWNEDMPMDRLCYCPGNHDLIRDERIRQEDNRHRFEYRKDVILNLARSKNAFLGIKDANSPRGKLVIDKPFQFFHSTMRDLTKDPRGVEYLAGNQIICFYPPCKDEWNGYTIVVVGMNTALLAGQVSECKYAADFQAFVSQQEATIDEAIHNMDLKVASTEWKKLIEACREMSGELIVDEGKLCLPQEEVWNALVKKLSNSRIIPILFGHHSSAYLNSDAKSSFNQLLRKTNIPVYLCGHAHQINDNRIGETAFSKFSSWPCLEVVGGGLFWDNSKYNQISFSIGTIELKSTTLGIPKLSTTIEHYVCVQNRGSEGSLKQDAGVWTRGKVTSESTINRMQTEQSGTSDELSMQNAEKKPEETRDETKNIPKEDNNRSEDSYREGFDEGTLPSRTTTNVKKDELSGMTLPDNFFNPSNDRRS